MHDLTSLLSELVIVKCWKYRSRNRGGLLHYEANRTALAGLTLECCFLVHCFIAQLRFTDIPDRRQSAETKNGRAKVPPVFPWSVKPAGPSLEGHFGKLLTTEQSIFYASCFCCPPVWCIPWYIPCPSPGFSCVLCSGVRRKIPPITQCLSNLASHRSLLTLHNLYLLRFFFFGVLLGLQLSVCSRTGCGLSWCSGLPLGSFPHPLFSVSVRDDSCCCLWSSLGIFCVGFNCSKSTFRSSLALLLDFLLVAILFLSCSSLSAGIPSLFMHATCLFHKSL